MDIWANEEKEGMQARQRREGRADGDRGRTCRRRDKKDVVLAMVLIEDVLTLLMTIEDVLVQNPKQPEYYNTCKQNAISIQHHSSGTRTGHGLDLGAAARN